MKINPLFDYILVRPKTVEEKTKSGIYLPKTAKNQKPEEGTVIAVGPGGKTKTGEVIPIEVKIGNNILFTKYGPTDIEIDGKDYLLVKEEDVLAIIN